MIKPSSMFEASCFLLFFFAFGVVTATTTKDGFDQVVNNKVQKLKIRGASVAYFDANTMTAPILRAYGKVSASNTASAVTTDTTFMIASISKVFTAAAIALILEQGYITSLDDDICEIIPAKYKQYNMTMCRHPQYPTTQVTWRMLMTHRSSLKNNLPDAKSVQGSKISPSYGPSGGYDPPAVGNPTCPLSNVVDFYHTLLTNDPTASTEVAADVLVQGNTPLNWYDLSNGGTGNNGSGMWQKNSKPGSKNVYSNSAYGYIAALIEFAVTDQSFTDFCHEHLFQPLGMDHTAWFRTNLPKDTREAVPVEYTRNNKKKWKDAGHYCFIDYASGELRTSAKDISKWAQYFIQNNNESTTTTSAQLLWSQSISQQMYQCQEQDVNGKLLSTQNCETGYGWMLLNNSMKTKSSTDSWLRQGFKDYDWTNGIWHDGAEIGSQTNLIILPNAGVYVAVLTNTDLNSEMAAQHLTQAVVQAPLPAIVTPPNNPTPPALDPTMAPMLAPTVPPIAKPSPNDNNNNDNEEEEEDCPKDNETKFVLELKTDHYPKDTKWKLKRNNKVIQKVGYNTYKQKYTKYSESFCIRDTGKYVFTIFDKFGDGLTEGPPNGSYKLFVGTDLKKEGNGKYKKRQTTKWKLTK